MAKADKQSPVTMQELLVSTLAQGDALAKLLIEKGIIGGYDLGNDYSHLKDHMLVCVTETNSKDEIDALVEGLKEVTQ